MKRVSQQTLRWEFVDPLRCLLSGAPTLQIQTQKSNSIGYRLGRLDHVLHDSRPTSYVFVLDYLDYTQQIEHSIIRRYLNSVAQTVGY
jgi:hypothetical protein